MNSSINKRLVGNFMLVIIITVLIIEFFLFNAIRDYYYKSVEEILSNQITFSTNLYSRYFSSDTLEDVIIDDVNVFLQHTSAQVQILDRDGTILMDSIGAVHSIDSINTSDVLKAIEGDTGTWIGDVEYDTEPVMAVSHPLIIDGEIVGVLRFISSLRETNLVINGIYQTLLLIGVIVIIISGLVSIFLSNTITQPLREVTTVAEKMADGQLKIRSKKRFNDEIGKLSDTLNYMAEELIKKEQLKNDFISSISHELRTPLTSIKGWAITLKSDKSNDDELLMDGLNIIEKESDRLSTIVDELLDFSRLVSGRITVEKEEMSIIGSIKQIGKQLRPRANDKNIKFDVSFELDLPNIVADENRIKQVLINLLDNALKFTQQGGKVSLEALKDNDNILIKVKDNGSGIHEEDIPYITEKFYKGKNSKANSGLGLSICDEIVKLHGGSIEIKSKLNQGTMVIVSLPIKGVTQ
ncbi:sensor histidine kinase [Schnuerera sp. xch1]|uniref:sensor histidine kinase n=1 Tax=Schnuerera sp. xch1 TaxID=2874283 RepID=UPI001CC092BA|nr:HAMP domain-containing sensor histidine kinase [Schnuerera sp. xch1]